MRPLSKIILVAIAAMLGIGCSYATGPLFREVPLEKHDGKALVYFYRSSQSAGVYTYDLTINGGNKLPLKNNGYFLLIVNPGKYHFTLLSLSGNGTAAQGDFEFQAGTTYYIRARADVIRYEPFFLSSGPVSAFKIVSESHDEALSVLNDCRLIEVPGNTKGYIEIEK